MSNQSDKSLDAVKSLRANASAYFDRLFATHKSRMACGAGCSKCCEVEGLSVHESEAMAIFEWFNGLSDADRNHLKNLWSQTSQTPAKTCSFLVNRQCSIYESRPIICRTQGAPLRFKVSEDEVGVDACPLNFTEADDFPAEGEWLDLDRLNTLLVIAEQSYQKSTLARPLQPLINSEGRVLLSSIRDDLISRCGAHKKKPHPKMEPS